MIYLFIGALLFTQAKSQTCDSNINCTDLAYPICFGAQPGLAGSCIQCAGDADCAYIPGPESVCEFGFCFNATITTTMYVPTSGGCTSDDECFGWVCDYDSGNCVVCRDTTDCENSIYYGVPEGYGSTCDLYTGFGNLCFTDCSDDNDCPGEYSLTPFCDTTGLYPGQCVNCNNDDDCDLLYECNSNSICTAIVEPTTTVFICSDDTECSDPTPYCMYGECSECKNDTTCADGYICEYSLSGYQCAPEPTTTEPPIDCTLDDECPAENPVCMTISAVCGQCNDADDCPVDYQCRWGGYNNPGSPFVSYCEPEPTTTEEVIPTTTMEPEKIPIANVTCGDTVYGTTTSSNLIDYYRLTLDESDIVFISTCVDGFDVGAFDDTYLYLYDASESKITENDDMYGDGDCYYLSEIVRELSAGDYLIGITGAYNSQNGDYAVSITCETPTISPDDAIVIECDSLVNGTINNGNQVDYYYLMLNETTDVNVTTCVDATDLTLLEDTVLNIYNEAGEQLFENDNSGPCFQKSTIVEELDEGKYIIGVSAYDPFESGGYYLLTTCSEPEPEFPDLCTKNEDCEDGEQCTPVSILGEIQKFCITPGIEICSTAEDCLPGFGCNFPDPQVPIGGCFIQGQSGGCTVDGDDCPDGLTCYDASSLGIDNICYLLCEDPVTDCGSDDYICASNSDAYSPAVVTTCFYAKEYTDDPTAEPTLEPTEDPTMEPTEVTGAPSAAPTEATPAPVEDEPISTLADGVEGLAVFGGMIIMIIHALFM